MELRRCISWSQLLTGISDWIAPVASQADSAGSIPVTRSSLKPHVRGLSVRPGTQVIPCKVQVSVTGEKNVVQLTCN